MSSGGVDWHLGSDLTGANAESSLSCNLLLLNGPLKLTVAKRSILKRNTRYLIELNCRQKKTNVALLGRSYSDFPTGTGTIIGGSKFSINFEWQYSSQPELSSGDETPLLLSAKSRSNAL